MKLYDVPRNTYILLDGHRFKFDHIDGMYSLCYDVNNKICHLAAWTEVKIDPNQKELEYGY